MSDFVTEPARLWVFQSTSTNPYLNLAIEQHLLENVPEDCCILYLWQNNNTVVIGRGQNAWKECRTLLLEQEGGRLARRLSGGGAVFHDLGNLNFTFLVPTALYDLDRQFDVLQAACQGIGIQVVRSGRNDILTGGRKFSGNAFYHHQGRSYHHGTILVHTDLERMGRYLCPSAEKLKTKSVGSVQARVVNLVELVPDLTCNKMCGSLVEAFQKIYQLPAEELQPTCQDWSNIQHLCKKNEDWDWIYGTSLAASLVCSACFDWGELQIQLKIENGYIQDAKVYTDSLDWTIQSSVERALRGCKYFFPLLQERIRLEESLDSKIRQDLCQVLKEQGF